MFRAEAPGVLSINKDTRQFCNTSGKENLLLQALRNPEDKDKLFEEKRAKLVNIQHELKEELELFLDSFE